MTSPSLPVSEFCHFHPEAFAPRWWSYRGVTGALGGRRQGMTKGQRQQNLSFSVLKASVSCFPFLPLHQTFDKRSSTGSRYPPCTT